MYTSKFVVAAVFFLSTVTACYSNSGSGGSAKSESENAPLMSPDNVANKDASAKNNEGVDHLSQGHFDVSAGYFKEAIAMQPDFAEAHYNLGVALDGAGDHGGATEAFKKAKEFGAGNPKIADSAILKKHLGM